jgi:FkbM family methyltransferase
MAENLSSTRRIASLVRLAKRVAKPLVYHVRHPNAWLVKDVEVVTRDGFRMLCLRENLIERTILETGEWEPWESEAIRQRVGPGDVALDVGANTGYVTLLLAKCCGEAGRVHCFEPTTYAYDRMMRNVASNPALEGRIRANKLGLLASPVVREEALESRFSERVLAHSEPELIRFTTIDSYCAENGIEHVNFMKVDVDGHDFNVVQGARHVLTTNHPILLLELNERGLSAHGASVAAYVSLLMEYGYEQCVVQGTASPVALKTLLDDARYAQSSWNALILP